MKTKTDLILHLAMKPQSHERDRLMERAANGEYHDFESQRDTPKVDLHNELIVLGFDDLAKGVRRGDYD